MMPSEWHDWHDFYMLLGTRLGCAGGAVVRRGVDRGKFSHARAQRRHANLHEPGRFPFQHASHHQSHRDGAVPHRAIARAIGIMLVAVAWLAYTTVVHVSLFANYLKS